LAQVPGFNFIFTPGNSNITIDALSRITDVEVLSSPSLVVQDNSEAVLTVGDEVPLVTRTSQTVDDPGAPIVANIEYRETGVILEVRPRINTNNVVTLEVSQEVSRVDEIVARADQNPIIAQRRITSKVNVTSGQTVVLGGLIQDGTTRGTSKVPVLGDVPVLGNLFRSTDNQSQRTELIVFITPRVIRNSEDAREISEELRARMRAAQPLGTDFDAWPPPAEDWPAPAERIPPPRAEPRPLSTSRATTGPEAEDVTDSGSSAAAIVEDPFDPAFAVEPVGFALDEMPLPLPRPIPGDLTLPTARPARVEIAL
jgi:type II secretory pathway component GspD/PulD (secretin)